MRGDVSKVDQSEDTINMELNSLERISSDDNNHTKGDPAHMGPPMSIIELMHASTRDENSKEVRINSFDFDNNLKRKFINDNIRLIPVGVNTFSDIKQTLEFYMGKNTPDRQEFIISNLKVEKDDIDTLKTDKIEEEAA
jgi:hypothetical protein